MIKPEELRTGNLVNIGYDCKVVRIDEFGATLNTYNGVKEFMYFNQKDIRPILLNEEWLIKFEFDEDRYGFIKDKIQFLFRTDNKLVASIRGLDLVQIKYVHQLQNLYYSITQEELITSTII
jgi:hypothetical protein